MPANEYHFSTRWHFTCTVQEVIDVLQDPTDLVRWWPSVYRDVKVIRRGDEDRIGEVVSLYTKGWLPYTLYWHLCITEIIPMRKIAFDVWGDFIGHGSWTFDEDNGGVIVTYEWNVRATKPLLHYFSFLLRPIFAANHRWAMKEGKKRLELELSRRQARVISKADHPIRS
jgi:hypothetical protein